MKPSQKRKKPKKEKAKKEKHLKSFPQVFFVIVVLSGGERGAVRMSKTETLAPE